MLDKEYCKSEEDCNNIGIHLTTIFQKTADLCLKNQKKSMNRTKKDNTKNEFKNVEIMFLYDRLKNDISNISKLLQKYPRDPYIRGRYFTLSKNIRKTIKKLKLNKRTIC